MADRRELTPQERPIAVFWVLGGMLNVPKFNALARAAAKEMSLDVKAILHGHTSFDCPNRASMVEQFERAACDLTAACPSMATKLLAAMTTLRTQEASHG
jgi:hypothetical protein